MKSFWLGVWIVCGVAAGAQDVRVEVEEDVYDFVSPDNGAGPMWSGGCTVIARWGDTVVVSQMETGEGVPKLNNTRWRLLRRGADGWTAFAEADGYRQREPCPIAVLPGGRLFLSVNDSTEAPGTHYGTCKPHVLAFDLGNPGLPKALLPEWGGAPSFTDHSYRGYAADAESEQLLVFNIDAKTSVEHWSLMSASGETIQTGSVTFPIRSCYPQVALTGGAGHIFAVGDIVEPVEEWREYKFEQTERKWDYVFRVLYYASTPDILSEGFGAPLEIVNVDDTAGYVRNQDLWIGPAGEAYLLYTEQEVQSALMRDKFFPGGSVMRSLKLAVVKDGRVVERRVLIEGRADLYSGNARFHESASGKVFAVLYAGGADGGNKLMQVYPRVDEPVLVSIPFEKPFTSFCLASERAGNAPSDTVDIFGHRGRGDVLSYGRLVIE